MIVYSLESDEIAYILDPESSDEGRRARRALHHIRVSTDDARGRLIQEWQPPGVVWSGDTSGPARRSLRREHKDSDVYWSLCGLIVTPHAQATLQEEGLEGMDFLPVSMSGHPGGLDSAAIMVPLAADPMALIDAERSEGVRLNMQKTEFEYIREIAFVAEAVPRESIFFFPELLFIQSYFLQSSEACAERLGNLVGLGLKAMWRSG